MRKQKQHKAGFTLLEILLVVAIISILAGIVIVAINPAKQLGDARNAQRRSDTLTILNAVFQYTIDHNGALPTQVNTAAAFDYASSTQACPLVIALGTASSTSEICKSASACGTTAITDLATPLVVSVPYYLTAVPSDPSTSASANETGYFIAKLHDNRIIVCAPYTENGVDTIAAVR